MRAIRQTAVLAAIMTAAAACDAGRVTEPSATVLHAERASLNFSWGTRSFELTGFSYGPNWEEYDTGTCNAKTYHYVTDSTQIFWSPDMYANNTAYKAFGCAINGYSEGPFDGGNMTYHLVTTDASGSVEADGYERLTLTGVPNDPNGQLLLRAYAHPGFVFLHWLVYSGSSYTFQTAEEFTVPLNTSAYRFHAEFKKLGGEEP